MAETTPPSRWAPFHNLAVNLQASGPAAVICVWCISVAAVGIFGSGPAAMNALTVLSVGGGIMLVALANRA